ncbi:MAG TPA: DUF4139 domain-containing protein, partial [Myxococcota bacterium]
MPQPAPGRLERVVVTANGALVTRRVPVSAGAARLVVTGLPLRLVDDTLRVRPAEGAIHVGLVEERCAVEVTAGAADVDEAALLEARLQVLRINQRRSSLKVLRAVGAVDISLPPPEIAAGPDAAGLLELLDAADRRAAGLLHLEQQLTLELRSAERALRDLEHRRRVDPTPPRVLRGIEVDITADSDGAVDVEYFVHAARWVPSYALHLRSEDGRRRARVVLGALIAQASGEDWNDVALAVTTARLDRASTLPIVHSWRLGRAQPAVVKGLRPLPSDLPQLFTGWDRFGSEPALPQVASTPPSPSPIVALPPPPPPPPSPKPIAARAMSFGAAVPPPSPRGTADADRDLLEDAMMPSESGDDDDFDDLGGADEDSGAHEVARRRSVPMAAPSMAPPMSMSVGSARMRGGPGGGGGGRSAPAVVVDELPPRLRTSGLRMAFADDWQRGLLVPMDLRERLAWLLDVADLKSDEVDRRRGEVHRALDALESAEIALSMRPLPPGTRDVDGQPLRVFGGVARTSIASDGHEHRVEVHSEDVAVEIVHHAVPRETLDVWRMAVLTPSGALPEGPVTVYDDGSFVVTGHVSSTAGQAMTFNLGVDPDVRIVSRTPHIQQAEKGLMGATSQVEHRVVTVVKSTKTEPVRLSLFDRLPTVDDNVKDITVTLTSSQPPLSRTDRGPDDAPLPGGVRAAITVMPGDTMRLEHTW